MKSTKTNLTQNTILNIMSDASVFRRLTTHQITQLFILADEIEVRKDDSIMHEGDIGDSFSILVSGSAEVFKCDENGVEHVIACLLSGSSIGEVALLDKRARSASVRATSDCHLLKIAFSKLELLDADENLKVPIVAQIKLNLAEEVGLKLRYTDETTVNSLREQLELAKNRVASAAILSTLIIGICVYVFTLQIVAELSRSVTATTFITVLIILILVFVFHKAIRQGGYPISDYGVNIKDWQRNLIEGILFSLPILGLVLIGKWLLIQWLPEMSDAPLMSWGADNKKLGFDGLLLDSLLYALFVPLQEFLARGCLQSTFSRFIVGRHIVLRSILMANLMFALLHIHLSITLAIFVFLPGLFWGWMYARHQSLVGVCISHILVGVFAFSVVGFMQIMN
ncbi:MAG: cyclic nucleotide-binding domain-containing protein [Mariprofundales bacterium]